MTTLPLRTKLLYSTSSFGGEALSQSRNLWLLYYYAPSADSDRTALLKLGTISLILSVGKLLEAVDDSLIGYWSDRTRSRLGRRLPFILSATPLMALFAFLMFVPPTNANAATVAIYFFVTFQLYSLFSTLSGGPYEALLPEIARSSRDRVTLAGTKVYFGVAGAAVGLVASPLLIRSFGFEVMAGVMALLVLAGRYTGMAGIWKHADRSQPPATISFRESMRVTFSNVNFLRFLPTFVLFQAGLVMLLGVLPYYTENVLRKEDVEGWVSILTATAILAMILAVPLFIRIARRTSKRTAFSRAMLAAAVTFPLLFFVGLVPGIPVGLQAIAIMAVVGAPVAGVYLFPSAITADICDDDANTTGMRREATFFGAQNFVEKTAGSLSPVLLAGVLMLGSTAANPLGIRLVGPVAGLVVLGGYLIFRAYDLPDEVEQAPPPVDLRVVELQLPPISPQPSAAGGT